MKYSRTGDGFVEVGKPADRKHSRPIELMTMIPSETPIIGQEAVCPDGLGRVAKIIWLNGVIDRIKIDTYIENRGCEWAPLNVRLVPLPALTSVRV